MDIIKKGTYILPQAKGYGTLKHSNTTIKFTNHITLWGKFQMANAIFLPIAIFFIDESLLRVPKEL